MKNVLILGKNSYLGESLLKYLLKYPKKYNVDIVSTLNYEWKNADFTNYDVVIDFAGIAHINNITPDMKDLFYSINRDLTIEIGEYAKASGVKHLIYFSSMNVYGDYCNNITDRTKVNPTSFYGDSKLQGDLGLEKLEDESFVVSHIRPPFVYGKGCSGNYNTISKIAKKTPLFPNFRNKKSMIYIDNLCEFVRLIINEQAGGVFTPQNKELVSTSDLVREISKVNGNVIYFTKMFNCFIYFGNKITRKIRRAFADDCYDLSLSDYFDFEYCIISFKKSIELTEKS